MSERDPFAVIADRLEPGTTVSRRWTLEGGVSAQVEAMELVLPDGTTQCVVIRQHGVTDWKPLEADVTNTEFALLKVLHAEGFAVPEPQLLDTSGSILEKPYMVMGFVDGSTNVVPDALTDALRQMASYLTRLHAIDFESIGLPVLLRLDDPRENTLRYVPDTPLGERIRAAHDRHGQVTPTNRPALLHGDFWPGNILWQDGTIAAVIDWEDAAIGDPVVDLAGSRLELLWKYGREAMEQFTSLYLSTTPIDPGNLPFWEISGATSALALMGEWGLEPKVEAGMRAKATWLIENALKRIANM